MNTCSFAVVALSVGASAAMAGTSISFVGPFDDTGTGFGSVLNVLSVQHNHSEWGSVARLGGSDVLAGNATNTSATRTVTELMNFGINADTLGVSFNINDPGNASDVTLQSFIVRFFDASDATLFDLTWTGPLTLDAVNQGTGGAGYLFDIDLTPAQATSFFADGSNRIGLIIPQNSPILDSFGGAENFYVVPTPGALSLLGMGLLAMRRRPAR